jgi:hypothetical protein
MELSAQDLTLRPPPPSQPKSEQISISNVPPPPTPPEPIKTQKFPDKEPVSNDSDEDIKRIRKERARQFMAELIRRKKSDDEPDEEFIASSEIVPKLIDTLITGQLQKVIATEDERKKSKSPRRRSKRSHSRSRSRTPKRSVRNLIAIKLQF